MSAATRRNERPVHVPEDAIARQRAAADPRASAWVSANAGSGKTFVLTRRVLRLLLAGAAPGAILCLTYTKAAAAEMRQRVGLELGRWARMDEGDLTATLLEVTGARPDPDDVVRARTLFAHALETPGGLKILTIHAFCEAVLQRFPREAGVPVDFSVIEDDARAAMLRAARESVLAEGLAGHEEVAEAVAYLFTHLSDSQIEAGVNEALLGGRALVAVLADPEGAKARLARLLGVDPEADEERLNAWGVADTLVPVAAYERVFAICPPGEGSRKLEDRLARVDRTHPVLDQLFAAFLKADGTPYANLVKADIRKREPDLAAQLEAEAERLAALFEQRKAIRLLARSAALIDVLVGIALRYEGEKRKRSLLDFDDLVTRAGALFANPELGDWVRYKLDAGIEHILVDEGQDTNAAQWDVVDALAADFFAGDGVPRRPRTLFAVGDPKQSIYSFQGAEPELFIAKGADYRQRARAAGQVFHDATLRTSFRTLPEILDGVDSVCAPGPISAALLAGEDGPRHESARSDRGGIITLWAPFPEPDPITTDAQWPLEPVVAGQSAARQLAERIVGEIARWLDDQVPLAQRGRAIRPEDILILVQSRKALFGEIVRALKRAGIASPGADRLPVTGHIAVRDLLGLADILLNPDDDLLLAAILRSPLYGVGEAEIETLAAGRGRGVTLWTALGRSDDPVAQAAHAELSALRTRIEMDRPYGLLAHVLYTLGGLKRFHARLGYEVDDVFAELLDLALEHEGSDQPSLTGFLARMRTTDITIKRDLAESAGGVRVMTVHGAKGLEAPIVILADATDPVADLSTPVFLAHADDGPVLVFPGRKDNLTTTTRHLHDTAKARQDAEHWRKLYVAMTRAEDHLIVTGTLGRRNGGAHWYEAISRALSPQDTEADSEEITVAPGGVALVYPADHPPAPIAGLPAMHGDEETIPLTLDPLAAPALRTVISPSLVRQMAGDALMRGGEALLDAETARRRGIAVHALLQHLGAIAPADRQAVAHAAAGVLTGAVPALAADIAEDALAILGDPALAAIFGPGSRAEVSFALDGQRDGAPMQLVGRMDRIVVDDEAVMVVDFKSDAAVPSSPDAIPPAYGTQMALYRLVAQRLFPGRMVQAAILWTATRRLMRLPDAMLDREAAAFFLT